MPELERHQPWVGCLVLVVMTLVCWTLAGLLAWQLARLVHHLLAGLDWGNT